MKPAIAIRRTDDELLVEWLHSKCFGDEFDRSPKNVYWVAWDGKVPVGFCYLRPRGHGEVFLARAGVLHEYRGLGLHKRLIRVRLRWCKANGYKSAVTYAHHRNYQSCRNLLDCGLELYMPSWDYAGEGFCYFCKALS